MRVTINGERFETSSHRYLESNKWSAAAGKAKGNTDEVRSINNYLDMLKQKAYNFQKELIQEGRPVNIENFKDKWLGKSNKPVMLIEIFQQHNDQVVELIGKDFAPGTVERYKTTLSHTRSFMQWKYKISDIDIRKLNYEFISGYEFWLKSVRRCNHNSTMKYLANFKKIVILCLKNGWLSKDPFVGFKLSKKEVVREFLTKEEMQLILSKQFVSERIGQVRDIFLFSCYTGLAYADVKKLKRSEIITGVDGEKWVFTSRQKTNTASRIPLLSQALQIIEKYTDHPQCDAADRLLPVLSNQKMNAYLKEIADVCGITKQLTYHIARHTFATTVTLSNGVPIESVSKMLGHKNIRTTQHYAKILDKKLSEDMGLLRSKLNAQPNQNLKAI
jgi:site-specific recombinase XerD